MEKFIEEAAALDASTRELIAALGCTGAELTIILVNLIKISVLEEPDLAEKNERLWAFNRTIELLNQNYGKES